MEKIISIHTPKAAGTSFREILFSAYGREKVLEDYAEDPVNPISKLHIDPKAYLRSPIDNLNNFNVVHGHFHPSKYSFIKDTTYITFLREPIDNILSIYYFWKNLEKGFHALHDYFIDHKLSIIEFVELPAIRYLYSKCYFDSFDMKKFEFIGDFSCFNSEVHRLSLILNKQFNEKVYLNKTSHKFFIDEKDRIRGDKEKMHYLAAMLKEDIQFYEQYRGR